MKARFTTAPTLNSREKDRGVASINTDMVLLTKVFGTGMGPGVVSFDKLLGGRIAKRIEQKGFKGQLGEHLSLKLGDGFNQKCAFVVGLGPASKYDECGLRAVIKTAVEHSLKYGYTKLSVLIVPKSQLSLSVTGTAFAIKEAVEEQLAAIAAKKEGTLEVELVCTPQAKRYIEKGLSLPKRKHPVACEAK